MADNDLNAYLKKRVAETGATELDPNAVNASKDAQDAHAAHGKDEGWVEQTSAEAVPASKRVVDVSLMDRKKKAEEEQKLMKELSPAKEEPKKAPKKPASKEIKFDSKPLAFRNASNETKDFPTMAEASKMKSSPAKHGEHSEHKPVPEKAEKTDKAEAEPAVPRFTNSKKKEDKPAFAKIEADQKELTHKAELISTPYSGEKQPREFKIAGEEKKKHEGKTFHNKGPRKEWTQEKEHEKGPRKDGKKDGPKREAPKKDKAAPKEEDKKAKAGDKVAAFAVAAPSGVR